MIYPLVGATGILTAMVNTQLMADKTAIDAILNAIVPVNLSESDISAPIIKCN
jgi:hypothetical protein